MEEYLNRRSKTATGFLRRGSGISSRNQSPDERDGHNTDGPGSTTRYNTMKTRLTDNLDRPRYLRDPLKSSSSKFMPGSSSKFPLRKFGEERQRQSLLERVDIAENSRRRADAKNLEGSKKIIVDDESSDSPQTESKGFSTKDGQLLAPDTEVLQYAGSSDVPEDIVKSLTRSVPISTRTHKQKDKELSLCRPGACSSSITNRPIVPKIPTIGVKPSHGLVSGEQRNNGPKHLGRTSGSDVLPSGCSSDSVSNRTFDAMRKRSSAGESSSRSRDISGPSSLGRSPTLYPGIGGSRIRTTEQSVSQQTIQNRSRNTQDSAVSVRTRRPSQDTRFRMFEEREDVMLSLHESTTMNQGPARTHSSAEEVSSQSSIRPFSAELPHAFYSSSRQGSNSQTGRRRPSSRFEESRPPTFRSLLRESSGHGRITMEGITEVLLALDRMEQEAELTYELMLRGTNLLLGTFGSHDQHSEMRMDIDNMSYEELLALEERMGSVSTALSEDQFVKCLKRSIYRPVAAAVNRSVRGDSKCSICQEEFMQGDEVGQLRCKHQYHVCCIRQWLLQKNWCPICKFSALPSLN